MNKKDRLQRISCQKCVYGAFRSEKKTGVRKKGKGGLDSKSKDFVATGNLYWEGQIT